MEANELPSSEGVVALPVASPSSESSGESESEGDDAGTEEQRSQFGSDTGTGTDDDAPPRPLRARWLDLRCPSRFRDVEFSSAAVGVPELRALQYAFRERGVLSERAFIREMGSATGGRLSHAQMMALFMKIDANSDGVVDWEEFASYMFLSSRRASGRPTEPKDVAHLFRYVWSADAYRSVNGTRLYHKDSITFVCHVEKYNLLVTAGRDGTIQVWEASNMRHRHTLAAGLGWINDCAYMSLSGRLAVVRHGQSLLFFDLAAALSASNAKADAHPASCVSSAVFAGASALCCAYHQHRVRDAEMLCVGDEAGTVTILQFKRRAWHLCDGSLRCHSLPTSDAAVLTQVKLHSDWVNHMLFVPDLGCLVTCSSDATVKLLDVERERVKYTFRGHRRAAFQAAWSAEHRLLATCGTEREVMLWSPYTTAAVTLLEGHTASVQRVMVLDALHQLVTLAADNSLRVWDLRTNRVVHSLTEQPPPSELSEGTTGRIMALVHLPRQWPQRSLLVAATNTLSVWRYEPVVPAAVMARASICGALYSPCFHQVVSAATSVDAEVTVYSVEGGEQLFSFPHEHPDAITALAFDTQGRRLITASHDGTTVRVMNFTNGAKLKEFSLLRSRADTAREHARGGAAPMSPRAGAAAAAAHARAEAALGGREITCIVHVERRLPVLEGMETQRLICCGGWNGLVYVFNDDEEQQHERAAEGAGSAVASAAAAAGTAPAASGAGAMGSHARLMHGSGVLDAPSAHRSGAGGGDGSGGAAPIAAAGAGDEPETLGYTFRMPSRRTADAHVGDITGMAFCPPSTLVSCGSDGRLVCWSLNTGDCTSRLDTRTGALEAVALAPRRGLLFAAGEERVVLVYDLLGDAHQAMPTLHLATVTSLCVDSVGELLVTGDADGMVSVWEVCQAVTDHSQPWLRLHAHWRSGDSRVCCLSLVDHPHLSNAFVVVGAGDGRVTLWSLNGAHVGDFAQPSAWRADDAESFRAASPLPPPAAEDEAAEEMLKAAAGSSSSRSGVGRSLLRSLKMGASPAATAAASAAAADAAVPEAAAFFGPLSAREEAFDGFGDPAPSPAAAAFPPLAHQPLTPLSTLRLGRSEPAWAVRGSLRLRVRSARGAPRRTQSISDLVQARSAAEAISPVPGDVWVRAPAGYAPDVIAAAAPGEVPVADVLTVVRVSRQDALGWSGAARMRAGHARLQQRHVPLSRMSALAQSRRRPWVRHPALSDLIGRVFCDPDTGDVYRSLCVVCEPTDTGAGRLLLCDIEGRLRPLPHLPPLQAGAFPPAPRSLALFLRRRGRDALSMEMARRLARRSAAERERALQALAAAATTLALPKHRWHRVITTADAASRPQSRPLVAKLLSPEPVPRPPTAGTPAAPAPAAAAAAAAPADATVDGIANSAASAAAAFASPVKLRSFVKSRPPSDRANRGPTPPGSAAKRASSRRLARHTSGTAARGPTPVEQPDRALDDMPARASGQLSAPRVPTLHLGRLTAVRGEDALLAAPLREASSARTRLQAHRREQVAAVQSARERSRNALARYFPPAGTSGAADVAGRPGTSSVPGSVPGSAAGAGGRDSPRGPDPPSTSPLRRLGSQLNVAAIVREQATELEERGRVARMERMLKPDDALRDRDPRLTAVSDGAAAGAGRRQVWARQRLDEVSRGILPVAARAALFADPLGPAKPAPKGFQRTRVLPCDPRRVHEVVHVPEALADLLHPSTVAARIERVQRESVARRIRQQPGLFGAP